MNKVLFYLELPFYYKLTLYKKQFVIISDDNDIYLSSRVLPLELNFLSFLLKFSCLILLENIRIGNGIGFHISTFDGIGIENFINSGH